MNTTDTRPVNEKALRRWVSETYSGSCATWTPRQCQDWAERHHPRGLDAFRPTDYTATLAYAGASARARATIDAVFHAVRNAAGPDRDLADLEDGNIGCSFTWHDGAGYRVTVTPSGILARLFRLELTGAWASHPEDGTDVPEEVWRTVRAFSRDRAGKVLRGALADVPATAAWVEASAR